MNDAPATSQVHWRELKPGQVSAVTFEFEMTATTSVSFSVKVGQGLPGAIYLNGDTRGPSPDEYWTFWP